MHFSQQTGGNIGKDPQTIVGVNIRYPETYEDERGELCEAWLPEWALHPDATATVVYVTIRPGQTRGWVVHHRQDDRVFVGSGSAKIVLYDAREGSASEGCVNELYLGSERRGVFTIPAGVYHAFENIGTSDVIFIDMPNRPYDRENPDISRLPLDTEAIPYRWRGKR
jgi:dTDP-4-dehydrorhamnose 3,5-epimerase